MLGCGRWCTERAPGGAGRVVVGCDMRKRRYAIGTRRTAPVQETLYGSISK
jgi:hypothetical protein